MLAQSIVLHLSLLSHYISQRFAPLFALVGDAGAGEGGHVVVEVDRRLEEAGGKRCARGFAQTHAEIEDGFLAQPLQQIAMRRFGRTMGRQAMVERVRAHGMEHGGGGGGHVAIEQNRHALGARG